MQTLPEGAPATLGEAFAIINAATHPTLDVLRMMVLAEAAGKTLYEGLADQVPNAAVQALLRHNGREELAHAHRVSRAIGKLTGTDYPVPEPDENPYLAAPPAPARAVTAEMLAALAQSEFNGDVLYEIWAKNTENPDVAQLLRQNGREETEHGMRLQQAAELLKAA
jgi:rubrerythrin